MNEVERNHTRGRYSKRGRKRRKRVFVFSLFILFFFVLVTSVSYAIVQPAISFVTGFTVAESVPFVKHKDPEKPVLDKEEYDRRMLYLAHKLVLENASGTLSLIRNPIERLSGIVATTTASSTNRVATSTKLKGDTLSWDNSFWPAKNTVYPNPQAILPFKRIVAFYGNLYSRKMGILGEYDPQIVLQKLKDTVREWEIADPYTPVQPALHYIAVVAQGGAGKDGMYRARMPDSEIDKVLKMAEEAHAVVFLDVQVGKSNLQKELPPLKKYLSLPNVHLGIDPEFSMKTDKKPGTIIGTMDATDINYAADFLAGIVKEYNLPPKVLTFYRFTERMVTNSQNVKTYPEVQMVLVMDGWGGQAHKTQAYKSFVYPDPIQFTGFKLFFKNDFKMPGSSIMTPSAVLKLTPSPIYIQYQ